ncbi:MAG: redox-sensing transcriptional repressor Rex [Pirellulaceae bacterium]
MSSLPGKPSNVPAASGVPKAVVHRLSAYLRELQHLQSDGTSTISSSQLGQRLGFTDAQVRKDLAYFGQFGYPGVGYRCDELITRIRKILGTDRSWPVALVGVGNLGRALLRYRGFGRQGFRVAAAFDADPAKVGQSIEDLVVLPVSEIRTVIPALGIRLAIIAVPGPEASAVANDLVAAGVEGILNFAPVTLALPNHVSRVGVDLASELEQLSYAVVNSIARP